MTVSKTSIAVLVVQLCLVSSIAAKYLVQRSTCPRVWARAAIVDPESIMRGRYLALQVSVDGCQSTLPSAKMAQMPHDLNGVPLGNTYRVQSPIPVWFAASLKVQDNKLVAIRIPDAGDQSKGQMVQAIPGMPCDSMHLRDSVDFYLPEHAAVPPASSPTSAREFWVEVTVPPNGPPRPLQLAVKEDGLWKPVPVD
jgi:hypothetical protein